MLGILEFDKKSGETSLRESLDPLVHLPISEELKTFFFVIVRFTSGITC